MIAGGVPGGVGKTKVWLVVAEAQRRK